MENYFSKEVISDILNSENIMISVLNNISYEENSLIDTVQNKKLSRRNKRTKFENNSKLKNKLRDKKYFLNKACCYRKIIETKNVFNEPVLERKISKDFIFSKVKRKCIKVLLKDLRTFKEKIITCFIVNNKELKKYIPNIYSLEPYEFSSFKIIEDISAFNLKIGDKLTIAAYEKFINRFYPCTIMSFEILEFLDLEQEIKILSSKEKTEESIKHFLPSNVKRYIFGKEAILSGWSIFLKKINICIVPTEKDPYFPLERKYKNIKI